MKSFNAKKWLITAVIAAFLASSAASLQAYSISRVKFSPMTGSYLKNNDRVNLSFDYNNTSLKNVYIFVLPYTKGNPSPNYAVSGSPQYAPGTGTGTGYFTISSNNVTVDRVHIYMKDLTKTKILYETWIDVRFYFGSYVYDVQLTPPSPADLALGDTINVDFKYVISEPAVTQIFARPLTHGSLTPNYGASGSPEYSPGYGTGAQDFRVYSQAIVDSISIQIKVKATHEVIYTKIVNTNFRYCDSPCIWYVNDDAAGAQSGGSWVNAFRHLQDAFDAAESGDQIWVASGTYYPDKNFIHPTGSASRSLSFALENGVAVYGGFDGTESSLDQRDWQINPTILSGNIGDAVHSDNSLHVLTSNNNDPTAILDGFTVTRGRAEGDYPDYIGGGLQIINGSPSIRNCLFTLNSAGSGAAVSAWSGGKPEFLNCQFVANTSTGSGGAVSIQHSGPIFRGCIFRSNLAEAGGAVFTLNNLIRPLFQSCLFNFNHATTRGGAIYNGATDNDNEFSPIVENCTIVNNSADSQCGGIYNSGSSSVIVNSAILWNNSDPDGTPQNSQYYADHVPQISYSAIENYTSGFNGPGNISDYPRFVYPEGLDNAIGTEDDNYYLLPGSPCIDTGDPSASMDDPDGTRNDMGAYGGPWSGLSSGVGVIPGSGYVFTTIGNLPSAFITQSAASASLLRGTANVTATQAANYHIPQYQNSPFGASLWIRGLFGQDDGVTHYKVQAAPWNNNSPPAESDFFDLNDTLYKIYYIYNMITHEWVPVSTKVGPLTVGSTPNVYTYTDSGFWSNLDLRLIWNTRAVANGLYTLRIKGYQYSGGSLTDVTPTSAQTLIVRVDNSPMTCSIDEVRYDSSSPYWSSATQGVIPECAIINLGDPRENLLFKITAQHPNGFMRQVTLDAIAGKNDYRGVIKTQAYQFTSGPLWDGLSGFFGSDVPTFQDWERCAYQFRLRAWSRVNNGFHYIYYREFNDHYFIDLGDSGCNAADVNKDGTVDLDDVYQISLHWLQNCAQ